MRKHTGISMATEPQVGGPPSKSFHPYPECPVLVPWGSPGPQQASLCRQVAPRTVSEFPEFQESPQETWSSCLGHGRADAVSDGSPSPASPSANSPPSPGGARRAQTQPRRQGSEGEDGAVSSQGVTRCRDSQQVSSKELSLSG